jgi:hypothetical protein
MKGNSLNFRFKKEETGVFRKNPDAICDKIEKESQVFGLTMGEFSLIDLIHSTLKKIGPSEVIVATWSAGIKDVNQVKWMVDTDLILDFKLLVDHSYVNRQKKYAASITDLFGKENIRTSEIHAKFVLLKNENFNVVITSSMNLNANKTCELFTIYESKEMFDLLYKFYIHHFETMQIGFESNSNKVNKCVESFFKNYETKEINESKHWSEI